VHVTFRAPRDFVFRWCTDYRSDDGKRCGSPFTRRVLKRTGRSILLQDLWRLPDRWLLNQNQTTLFPPDRWHVDSFGTLRVLSIDYSLTSLAADRTRLDLRIHRRPTEAYPEQPSRSSYERDLTTMWRGYARSLERDFRRRSSRSGQ
jgi:hypothetical protein